ncbi:hypothetical protein ON010_g10298 [Phytophthora cinnamomi]|nr:hypothetical protein ON010_g10298 [Phytophthora cinnamomi]
MPSARITSNVSKIGVDTVAVSTAIAQTLSEQWGVPAPLHDGAAGAGSPDAGAAERRGTAAHPSIVVCCVCVNANLVAVAAGGLRARTQNWTDFGSEAEDHCGADPYCVRAAEGASGARVCCPGGRHGRQLGHQWHHRNPSCQEVDSYDLAVETDVGHLGSINAACRT